MVPTNVWFALAALALLYCGAAAVLAMGLLLGAIIGPHWCHMLAKSAMPTLGQNTAVVFVSNMFGIILGAAAGAATSLFLGCFFAIILILYMLETLVLGAWWLIVHTGPALMWLVNRIKARRSIETVKEGFDTMNTALLSPSDLFKTKSGFQRHNAIQVSTLLLTDCFLCQRDSRSLTLYMTQTIRKVGTVTGRWPGLMNKTSSLLIPTLGIKPAWWDQRNTEQWRETTAGIGPTGV